MLMGLNHNQFLLMKQGIKTIEVRLNDEKRSLLEVGSLITFVDAKTQEKLNVTVDKIYKFKTFSALYRQFYGLKVGSATDDSLETMVNDTYAIYSPEQEEKYGVLAIKISLNF
ncbi:ASCH domain-containing protein [Liquorilactobacillus vini]|nr:ASCH domain-containing protein [Liquorilactobacillus vini]